MLTIDSLKHKISSTQDLQAIVRMMKTLAAASIQQCEHAVESLAQYNRTIELGLRVVLAEYPELAAPPVRLDGRTGLVVFGSDQGLCGQFNEQIATHALGELQTRSLSPANCTLLAVGNRIVPPLEAAGWPVTTLFSMPSASSSITPTVQALLLHLEAQYDAQFNAQAGAIATPALDQVILCYHQLRSRTAYAPHTLQLLPIDQTWLAQLRQQQWCTRVLPSFTLERTALFAALIRQYLFVVVYRAFAESLASENASRLTAMQLAEQNIGERLTDYNTQFQSLRQTVITEEILEVLSGFEVLTQTPDF